MVFYLLLSSLLSLVWMIVTTQFNTGGFVVGYAISLTMLFVLRPEPRQVHWQQLSRQLIAAVWYVLTLFRDIFLSSIDVAQRALSPDMRLKPGIIAVPTQDPEGREVVAALAAHNITITPGEMVVDFDSDNRIMYVHCLNVDQSKTTAEATERVRLQRLRNLLGDHQ